MRRRGAGQLAIVAAVVAALGCTAPPATSPTVTRPGDTDVGGGEVTTRSHSGARHRGPDEVGGASAEAVESMPLPLLREWDAARATAYAEGSSSSLRRLYTPGSQAGQADVEMLREYVERDLRVVGMEMQILRVEVLDHRPGEWRLRVTDRLHRAVAVSARDRLRLPRDRATTRELRLVRAEGGRWLVADVRAAGQGASDAGRR